MKQMLHYFICALHHLIKIRVGWGAPDPQFSDPAGSKPDLDILVPARSGPDPTTLNLSGSGSELRDPGII